MNLTEEEWASVCMLAAFGAGSMGEDIIGGLTKYGAFHILKNENELVNFARKIGEGEKLFDKLRYQKLDQKKKQNESR